MSLYGWWADNKAAALTVAGDACSAEPTTKSDHEGASTAVLATAHVAPGRLAVIVVASWCSQNTSVVLNVDWKLLGLDSASAVVEVPAIAGLQTQQQVQSVRTPIHVSAGQGFVMTIKSK